MQGRDDHGRFAEVWDTPEKRKTLFQRYYEHVAAGYSEVCFPDCSRTTIKRLKDLYPEDFPPEEVDKARRVGQFLWERMGLEGTSGQFRGFNAKSWAFVMQNKFGWSEKRQEGISGNGPTFVLNVPKMAQVNDNEVIETVD